MEIVEVKTPNKNQQKKKTDIIIVNPKPVKKQGKRKNRARGNRQNGPPGNLNNAVKYYEDHIMYPDILGPFRQPRFGASNRTGLGLLRGRVVLTGSATTVIQGVSLVGKVPGAGGSVYNLLTASAAGAGLAIAAGGNPSVNFPNWASVADANVTAMSLVITYLGNPLNVAGELIVGASIPLLTTATYNSMYDYPNTTRFPISSLINNPLRVFGRKMSERANEFLPIDTVAPDWDFPYVITSGLPASQTISVQYVITHEYRSTTQENLVIPFDKSGTSKAALSEAFEAAADQLSGYVSPVAEALPSFVNKMFSGVGSAVGRLALQSAVNVGNVMTSRYIDNLTRGQFRQRPLVGYRDEL